MAIFHEALEIPMVKERQKYHAMSSVHLLRPPSHLVPSCCRVSGLRRPRAVLTASFAFSFPFSWANGILYRKSEDRKGMRGVLVALPCEARKFHCIFLPSVPLSSSPDPQGSSLLCSRNCSLVSLFSGQQEEMPPPLLLGA